MARWAQVLDYEGLYEVSDDGRVRSVDRLVTHRKNGPTKYKGRELRQTETGRRGYLRVSLSQGSIVRDFYVHFLVARAFVAGYFPDALVRHLDDVSTNNQAINLAWGTMVENYEDYRRNTA